MCVCVCVCVCVCACARACLSVFTLGFREDTILRLESFSCWETIDYPELSEVRATALRHLSAFVRTLSNYPTTTGNIP